MSQSIDYRGNGEQSSRWYREPKEISVPIETSRTALIGLLITVIVAFAIATLFVLMAVSAATAQQPVQMQAAPQPVALVMEDQFERKADLADLRGNVAILVYGDQKATDTSRKVGESLHTCWHPDAKGQPPAKARVAPVAPLTDLKPGQASPNVVVVPVACCGKVPGFVRGTIRGEIAKGSPDVVVWLDFADQMKTTFGLTAGEPNLVVFDGNGRLRFKCNGTPDQPTMDRLVKVVQGLRYEAVK